MDNLMQALKGEANLAVKPRPYFNHSVSFKGVHDRKARTEMMEKVGLNVFFFPADMITGCDFLSDSGTTTMTDEQWAALHMGDESYGSNKGYFMLRDAVNDTFGQGFWNEPTANRPNAFLFHQGRAAEDALFSVLGALGEGQIIPSNGHFDTTEANIEANKIEAVNLFSSELKDPNSTSKFKGNIDTNRLKTLLAESADKIPVVYITITNNTGGGQPVSMANIKEASEIANAAGKPLFLDSCRFAENAWFIQKNEEGYAQKSIKEIVREMFSYADGFTISFKKDGLSNMGGGLFLRDGGKFMASYPQIPDMLTNLQILQEGHPTYGGMSGRDIMTLVVGLKTITRQEYLDARVQQVIDFGQAMVDAGIPVLTPFGGHAVYLDVNRFFEGTNMQPGDFGGISFTAILLAAYGHRACELGYFAFGSYNGETNEEKFPEVNFVRFAVPRLRYEKTDLDSVVEAVKEIYENRDKIPPTDVIYGKELPLRHFKARFEFKN